MSKKSIAIIGKGPSILRSKKEIIDYFDDVAICNHPVFKNYEKYISNRAHLDFSNCGDPAPYSYEFVKKLGIREVFDIGARNITQPPNGMCPFDHIKYHPNIRGELLPFFKKNYDLDPSCGIFALEKILQMKKYDRIGLFGFDLMKQNEKVYYYKPCEVQNSIKVYFKNGTYDGDNNIRLKKSSHDIDKTYKYLIDTINNNSDIQFYILSNRLFPKLNNITIID